ncbi:hypothetical protein JCM8547_008526 [Rhodosporidiobolus lusitaniae]
MLSRTARTLLKPSTLTRTYVTAAPTSAPPPIPLVKSAVYDADEEPALHDMHYPKLSRDSRQLRPAFVSGGKRWDDMQERRNFGEPVPENEDIQSMWAPDVHKVKPASALSQLLFMFGVVGVFALGVDQIRARPHALPRGYPNNGLVREMSGTDDEQYAVRKQEENEIADE